MPYIYTHSEQQRKITVIVICHLRRIWARARVAAAHYARAPREADGGRGQGTDTLRCVCCEYVLYIGAYLGKPYDLLAQY